MMEKRSFACDPPMPPILRSTDMDQIIIELQNEVRECHKKLREHEMYILEFDAKVAMLIKHNYKVVVGDDGTSKGVDVHC